MSAMIKKKKNQIVVVCKANTNMGGDYNKGIIGIILSIRNPNVDSLKVKTTH